MVPRKFTLEQPMPLEHLSSNQAHIVFLFWSMSGRGNSMHIFEPTEILFRLPRMPCNSCQMSVPPPSLFPILFVHSRWHSISTQEAYSSNHYTLKSSIAPFPRWVFKWGGPNPFLVLIESNGKTALMQVESPPTPSSWPFWLHEPHGHSIVAMAQALKILFASSCNFFF